MTRVARMADLDALVALEEVCEGRDAWSPTLVAAGVAGEVPTTTWLVTEPEAHGYAVVAVVDDVAELQRIGVGPEHRRRGLARALLDEVVARSRRDGAVRILLEVHADNAAAIALYQTAGFAEIARRPRYYADGATAVVMERADHLVSGEGPPCRC